MPSPAAHSLIGLSIGMARFLPRAASWRELGLRIWEFRAPLFVSILLANAPDIDYLFGVPSGDLNLYHQGATHTIIWSVALSLIIVAFGWPTRSWRSFMFVLALPISHLVADFFTADYSEPFGMMLGWPFCDKYWTSAFSIFPAPAKSGISELLSWHNFRVVMRELLFMLPLVALAAAFKVRGSRRGVEGLS